MADVVLFHHVHGLTTGVQEFADELRAAGHTVHTPDLFEGQVFDTLEEGMAFSRTVPVDDRAAAAVEGLPAELVYGGFSMGVMCAQTLASSRPGAVGGLLLHSAIDPQWVGPWPDGVPAQIHAMEADPFFIEEDGDLAAAEAMVAAHDGVELFLYPGDEHLFTDSSLAAFDADATALVMQRALAFLGGL
ncbi:dienelactone hydrolase [Nocardioides szechwanensis]|uniref:Dienelactone hydrolase n=1 Tax=Nocardioides szechwanensis TaxID=1005944 RepID=A0A1G9W981_9ACTN|nr:dienelactone hydrolase family protein [Nocardioides szechwanensis]GEP32713.1 dienelactone hydrolase [Nocardioides szechwanensis]SDM80565.1 Dienelactone hydrolase [Nocardioides szechwanensis]